MLSQHIIVYGNNEAESERIPQVSQQNRTHSVMFFDELYLKHRPDQLVILFDIIVFTYNSCKNLISTILNVFYIKKTSVLFL